MLLLVSQIPLCSLLPATPDLPILQDRYTDVQRQVAGTTAMQNQLDMILDELRSILVADPAKALEAIRLMQQDAQKPAA